jgi:Mg-chelatase subunit ChlD
MNTNKLFDLFGVKPEAAPKTKNESKPVARTDMGPYVFAVDRWDIAHAGELVQEGVVGMSQVWQATDCVAMFFHEELIRADKSCASKLWESVVERYMDTKEFQELRQVTVGNIEATKQAVQAFCRIDFNDKVNPAPSEADLWNAVRVAIHCSQQVVQQREERNDIAKAFGCDDSDSNQNTLAASQVDRIQKAIHDHGNSEQLRNIMALAGRYRRMAQSTQRTKTSHGQDEITGVEPDNELSRLLSTELARLGDEDLELDFLRRFVEAQTICHTMCGTEKLGAGPIVVVVDESGSMREDGKIENAKAFALAMAWIAKHQNRTCMLVSFAKSPASIEDIPCCVIRPNAWAGDQLVEWLGSFLGGGTHMTVPLSTVPFVLWDRCHVDGRSDMILLSDGVTTITRDMETKFLAWKKEKQVRVYSLLVGTESSAALQSISDDCRVVSELSADNSELNSCFSI